MRKINKNKIIQKFRVRFLVIVSISMVILIFMYLRVSQKSVSSGKWLVTFIWSKTCIIRAVWLRKWIFKWEIMKPRIWTPVIPVMDLTIGYIMSNSWTELYGTKSADSAFIVNRRDIIKTKLQNRLTDSPLVIYELVNLSPRHGSIYGSIRFEENLMTGISYVNDFQKIINRFINHS